MLNYYVRFSIHNYLQIGYLNFLTNTINKCGHSNIHSKSLKNDIYLHKYDVTVQDPII